MKEWQTVTLGDVIQLQRGFDLTEKQASRGNIPVFSSGGISYSTAEPKCKGPGVITGRKGVLGKVHYSPGEYWPHDTTLWVKDFKYSWPRFIYYLLQTLPLATLDAGASNPTLNRNHAHLLPVRVPPPHVQKRIAEVLGALDDLIENNRRQIELLDEMAQAIYREWFVYFRYPGHEKDKVVDSPLGRIPQGWDVRAANEAISINPKVSAPKNTEVPFVAMADLSERSMLVASSSTRAFGGGGSRFERYDTLFARITPCIENGKTGFVQFLGANDVAKGSTEFIVMRQKRLSPFSVYLLARRGDFRQHAIRSMAGASGRQRVNNACFRTFFLALAPHAIEDQFAEVVEPMFTACETHAKEAARLASIRDLVLPRLIAGQIDVSKLDLDAVFEGAVG